MSSTDEPYVAPQSDAEPLPSVEIMEYVGFWPFGHYISRGMTAEEIEQGACER